MGWTLLKHVKISAFIRYYRGVVIDYQTRIRYLESLVVKNGTKDYGDNI